MSGRSFAKSGERLLMGAVVKGALHPARVVLASRLQASGDSGHSDFVKGPPSSGLEFSDLKIVRDTGRLLTLSPYDLQVDEIEHPTPAC
jgi:hypothetical protein